MKRPDDSSSHNSQSMSDPGRLDDVMLDFSQAGVGWAETHDLGWLRIEGSDRAKFLNGQCTQDVKTKMPGQGGAAFVLDAKGRNLGEILFTLVEETILIAAPKERCHLLQSWLQRFIIASDVHVAIDNPGQTNLLVGPRSTDLLSALTGTTPNSQEGSMTRMSDTVIAIADHRAGAPGFLVRDSAENEKSLLPMLQQAAPTQRIVALDPQALDVLRVLQFRPRFSQDIDETTLPVESGQFARTVSLSKGCYSGQEVVARQHFLGKARRQLCRFRLSDGVKKGDVLIAEGQKLGVLTSVVRSPSHQSHFGLGLVKGNEPAAGEKLSVFRGDSSVGEAEVLRIPGA